MKRLKKIKSLKDIPVFKNEEEEAMFYNTHSLDNVLDELEIIDMESLKQKAKKKAVTVRIDEETLKKVKKISKKLGIGYTVFLRRIIEKNANELEGKI